MNTKNSKKEAAPDKNHLIEEGTMKTVNIKKGIRRGPVYIALTAGFLIIAFGLIAQPILARGVGRFGPPTYPDEIVQTLTDRLDLTEEQVEAIRPIIEEKVRTMNEIRDKSGTDRKSARAEMQKIRWYNQIKLSEILTEEQVDKYLELRQEQHERRHRGKFFGGKMSRGWLNKGFNKDPQEVIERMSDRLDLTEEQAAEVEPIIKESIEKKREVFDKYREQGFKVRESMRSEMQSIGDETHAQLETILTDEQIEELNTIREERRSRMDKRMSRPGPMGF